MPAAALFVVIALADRLCAEMVQLPAVQDNTLYEYDPANEELSLNSNGQGNFFSAGRSLSRGQLRRGLIQFDLSPIPPGAQVVPGSAQLQLYAVDVPRRDPSPRPFWLVAVDQAWGEGTSTANAEVSGSGSGVSATAGDATWFHTHYDPSEHDDQTFVPGGAGYWPLPGALGGDPLDVTVLLGDPQAIAQGEIGPVTFAGASLEQDINQWLSGGDNFGWLVLGDELLAEDDQSSVRGFASHEHENADFRPVLSFEYVVPEPAASLLGWSAICGAMIAVGRRGRRLR